MQGLNMGRMLFDTVLPSSEIDFCKEAPKSVHIITGKKAEWSLSSLALRKQHP